MEKETPLYQGRIEEVPFIAAFLIVSLKRDLAKFTAYSPKYNDKFVTDFEGQKIVVENLLSPAHLTGERKVLTKKVSAKYKKIRNLLNRIADYINLAEAPLTLGVNDFGISETRDQLLLKNDEGIVKALRTVFENVEANKVALETSGYTTAISTEFSDLINSLATDSIAQTSKLDSRIVLTQENIVELNKLWKIMQKVMESGKNIANEEENSLMLKDYTYDNLEKKVRLTRHDDEPPAPKS